MRVKEGSEKAGLKLSIQKTEFMASGPIISRQKEGGKVEAVTDFLLLSSKITVVGDCSHEIRSHLLLERKAMANLDSILKSRDITVPTKVRIDKAMVWQLDHKGGWVVLQKTLESPLDCKEIKPIIPKGDQPWIFTGSTDAEAEAPILWPLDARTDSLEKTLILGKIEDRRRRGW